MWIHLGTAPNTGREKAPLWVGNSQRDASAPACINRGGGKSTLDSPVTSPEAQRWVRQRASENEGVVHWAAYPSCLQNTSWQAGTPVAQVSGAKRNIQAVQQYQLNILTALANHYGLKWNENYPENTGSLTIRSFVLDSLKEAWRSQSCMATIQLSVFLSKLTRGERAEQPKGTLYPRARGCSSSAWQFRMR